MSISFQGALGALADAGLASGRDWSTRSGDRTGRSPSSWRRTRAVAREATYAALEGAEIIGTRPRGL